MKEKKRLKKSIPESGYGFFFLLPENNQIKLLFNKPEFLISGCKYVNAGFQVA